MTIHSENVIVVGGTIGSTQLLLKTERKDAPLSELFLAIGAGAVLQVAYEIGRQMLWKGMANRQRPVTVFAGVLTGMLTLYITGLALK